MAELNGIGTPYSWLKPMPLFDPSWKRVATILRLTSIDPRIRQTRCDLESLIAIIRFHCITSRRTSFHFGHCRCHQKTLSPQSPLSPYRTGVYPIERIGI